MSRQKCIAVAMSGGVDSSVAAALIQDQGLDVFGIYLSLWEPEVNLNQAITPSEDHQSAHQVANHLGIRFRHFDARQEFMHSVVRPFICSYRQGETPNPCLWCNQHLRWGFLLQKARELGATHIATGHYARLRTIKSSVQLLRATDRIKDQSYFLAMLSQEQLQSTIFPLGNYSKSWVRSYAKTHNLPHHDRRESQDLCFVTNQTYRDFLRKYGRVEPTPGPILDELGNTLGQHSGLTNYTIGQRKGIGIAETEPLYVLMKDLQNNALIVGPKHATARNEFELRQVHWIRGIQPQRSKQVHVRVRYQAPEVRAKVIVQPNHRARVEAKEAVLDVTPGQAAIFYDDEVCLGGGIIDR